MFSESRFSGPPTSSVDSAPSGTINNLKVAYQGEPGAYSEKASRELLGDRITTVPYESFDAAFKAVASREVDYAVIPIENSLGGSIHTNYDLLVRYDLHVVAEHEFRVEHSLLALPGVKKEDIKNVMSHPQALAQCDNYLRSAGMEREATYDTSGSAKIIKEKNLRDCAAIASDLAGEVHGLDVLESNIEDHDNNFTRFIVLSREPVSSIIPPHVPAKTSIVFVLPNDPGALYKALACFSLRDIDFCKIESRPTSVGLLQMLQFQKEKKSYSYQNSGDQAPSEFAEGGSDLPRFRYTFYLDFLASEFDDRAQNALMHLRELSDYVRVLGSFPKGSHLIGSLKNSVENLKRLPSNQVDYTSPPLHTSLTKANSDRLKIGVIGFGKFGQFLAKTFSRRHDVFAVDKDDMSTVAKELDCEFFPLYDLSGFKKANCDVIVFAVSIISFEDVIRAIPKDILKGKLVVDVLSVKTHAKQAMLSHLPEECDIMCTHPMFGPESGKFGWHSLPFLYDSVRVNDVDRSNRFLEIWEQERCKMIQMTCELHDEFAANSQFITHLIGRILWQQNLTPTPIDTKGFQTVLNLVENTCKDSFDLFFGLYFYNKYAVKQLQNIREALSRVERQLAAREAYLAAKQESNNDQRAKILDECRSLMREAITEGKLDL
jgi:prephenate dehydratase/prephenate dehydrogenase